MRRTVIAGCALLTLLLGTAIPALAYHGAAIDGVWQATDVFDGSRMTLIIRETDPDAGTFSVRLHDNRTAFGGPAMVIATDQYYNDGNGQMNVAWQELIHKGKTSDIGLYEIFYVQPDGTMTDDSGNTWYHLGG